MTQDEDNLADSLVSDALSTLVPFGGTIGERTMRAVRREWARNTSGALKAAERASGLTREDLEVWIDQDPRAVPLYMKVLWTAGMNGHDATLRAMGAVLGQAAKASARGDDEALIRAELALQAMSELGPLHFAVLSVISESVVLIEHDGAENFTQFMPSFVSERAGMSESLTSQCLLNLANAGLAEFKTVFDGNAYPLTELGRAVLRAAEAVHA
jgi:hypothetical protein